MKWYNPKIQLLNSLSLSKQKGFTLVEVVIAFLVVTLFVSFTLQGMVLASLVQIRARDRAEASLEIQRNLELIRNAAATYLQPIAGETEEQKEAREAEIQTRCKAESVGEGMAAGLKAAIDDNLNLPNQDDEFIATASNRRYVFNPRPRPLDPSNPGIAPIALDEDYPNILQITYQVKEQKEDDKEQKEDDKEQEPLVELSTEVIPDVSLQCP